MIESAESAAAAERRAKRVWVSLVVVLLTLQVLIGGVAIYLSTGDRSVAIVPDYHNAALQWDRTKEARTAAARLGWKLDLLPSDVADQRGMRAIELRVHDQHGAGVESLRVAGRVYHHARAGEVKNIEFRSIGAGRYLTMAPTPYAGLWQIDVSVAGGPAPMTLSHTLDFASVSSAGTE